MNKQRQTTFGDKTGNCWSACIASLLEVPLEIIPSFCVDDPDNWWDNTCKWLEENYGLWMLNLEYTSCTPKGYWIATGKSPRGDFLHCIIYYDNKMVFDPHPSDLGIIGEPTICNIFYPIDPKIKIEVTNED
jgi:hypothetical protein